MTKRFTSIAATFALAGLMSVSATAVDTPSNTQEWVKDAGAAINEVMSYPATARNHGKTGSASYTVTIDREGNVVSSYAASSTGVKALDNASNRALKNADFPAIPASFAGSELTFTLEMSYQQRQSKSRQDFLDNQSKGSVTGTRIALLGGASLAAAK